MLPRALAALVKYQARHELLPVLLFVAAATSGIPSVGLAAHFGLLPSALAAPAIFGAASLGMLAVMTFALCAELGLEQRRHFVRSQAAAAEVRRRRRVAEFRAVTLTKAKHFSTLSRAIVLTAPCITARLAASSGGLAAGLNLLPRLVAQQPISAREI